MKIIIAPAKKMIIDQDSFPVQEQPTYLAETQQILTRLRTLSYPEIKALWHCSDKLAQSNYQWLHELDLTRHQTPALLSYSGIQYRYMAPDIFTEPALNYVQANLRILSGFYGLLRPFDGVVPYRLEMQAKLALNGAPNLYQFWGAKLAQALTATTTEPIINLASVEYAKAVTPYLAPGQPFVNVTFASLINGQLKVKATLAKMARGAMVRYLAEHQSTSPSDLQFFDHPNYQYAAERSTPTNYVFIYHEAP